MIVKLLTEHHLEFLSLKGGCTGSSESTRVQMPHCWKSHVMAHILYNQLTFYTLDALLRMKAVFINMPSVYNISLRSWQTLRNSYTVGCPPVR